MKIHIGLNGGKSKTEAMFVPHSRTKYEDADTSDLRVLHGTVGFSKTFRYLGSSVSWDLKDDGEVDIRIKSAGAAFGQLIEKSCISV